MVAYSFRPQFIEPIQAGAKRQTVRGFRARHARPGEPIQLYTAMRTRHCRKILTPDPICTAVRHVEIHLGDLARGWRPDILIEGVLLDPAETEAFALADGFASTPVLTSSQMLTAFWKLHHPGIELFEGVVIEWEPQQ